MRDREGAADTATFGPLSMADRVTTLLIDRLRALAARKARFCYDVRGNSYVYDGVVAPYRVEVEHAETNELLPILEHALVNDGMVTGVKDPASGKTLFTSGRHYTDVGNALRFAREQGQTAVYNWNRQEEVPVVLPAKAVATPSATTEVEG